MREEYAERLVVFAEAVSWLSVFYGNEFLSIGGGTLVGMEKVDQGAEPTLHDVMGDSCHDGQEDGKIGALERAQGIK